MRTKLLVLALFPLLAACQLDIIDLGDWDWDGGWGCCWPEPELVLSGLVEVGDYLAEGEEVTVYFYDPADTLNPVDSVVTEWDGRYVRSWWEEPNARVCDWLGQAVLWSGETGPLEPVFGNLQQPCDPTLTAHTGPTLVVEYEPLVNPFVLTGRVLADDEPAQLEVFVRTRMLDPYAGAFSTISVTSDDDGIYRFPTTDPAQRFSWCRWTDAHVDNPPSDEQPYAFLGQLPDIHTCGDGRTLPDIRFGTDKAVTGHVEVEERDAYGFVLYRLAEAGEARVSLLDPSDSTAVLGPVETLDDGSFHLWWPAEVSQEGFPGCDWLLEVEVEDERSMIVALLDEGRTSCGPDVGRWVTVQ